MAINCYYIKHLLKELKQGHTAIFIIDVYDKKLKEINSKIALIII